MKTFDFSRFCQYVKLDFVQYFSKSRLGFLIGGFLAYFFGSLGLFYVEAKVGVYAPDLAIDTLQNAHAYNVFFTGLLFLVAVSLSFVNLSTKSRRTTTLMVPASNAEKLVSALLVWPLAALVATIPLFGLADLLRQIVYFCFTGYWGTSAFLYELSHGFNPAFQMDIRTEWWFGGGRILFWTRWAYVGMIASLLAFYAWGSSVFRRHPFVLTSLLYVAIVVLFSAVLGNIFVESYAGTHDFLSNVLPVIAITETLLTVYLIWQTCYNFRHAQITRRKLF